MMDFIPYAKQWIDEDDIQAVVDILRGDYLTTGPAIAEFEEMLAHKVGARYAVAVSNGTAALHAACYVAGIGEGDEVITSPMTFAASANCVMYVGGKPVFADIDNRTYNIDSEEIARLVTHKTKAVIPVHYTGQPCDMDRIHEIAQKHGLVVIEDAAHALGAAYKGRKIGSMSDMTTFSFHPVKHITTGEGGAITTDSRELYDKLILFRSHGQTRNLALMENNEGPWYYEQQLLGYNYRITDIQAALGISQLKKLDMFLRMRRQYAAQYHAGLADLECVTLPYQMEQTDSAWHLYMLRIDANKIGKSRREIFDELKNADIGVNVHYIPVYYHPYYQGLGYQKGLCPKAERLYEELITLPLFPRMTADDVQRVIECVHKAMK